MKIFDVTKKFPAEEKFSMVDQMRRSSRSVCANLAEAWRKRLYKAHFVSKLSDSAGEADETRVWLELSLRCQYISEDVFNELDNRRRFDCRTINENDVRTRKMDDQINFSKK